jgi:peptide deformylase
MPRRPILFIPDPRLKQVAAPVVKIDDAVKALAAEMFETMYEAPGIGLAAPQIGVMKRLITIDIVKDELAPPEPMVLINPEITWSSTETRVYEEGCLSIPEFYEEVERPDRIRIRFQDLSGETIEMEAGEILSPCMQHEVDHLNGVLFIDHISRLKRDRITKKFQKAAKRAG